jgi:hypothetical protein
VIENIGRKKFSRNWRAFIGLELKKMFLLIFFFDLEYGDVFLQNPG